MKGVSTVIVVILLLLISIAIVGYTFGFFQRFFGTATSSGTQQLIGLQHTTGQAVRIEVVSGNNVTIRNIGSVQLTNSTLGVFVDGTAVTWASGTVATIPPNAIATLANMTSWCTTGKTIVVTTPGLSDSRTC